MTNWDRYSVVYALAYPKGFVLPSGEDVSEVVFYVGQGARGRIEAHESEALTKCRCNKCQVIRLIWDARMMVKRFFIAEYLSNKRSKDLERECLLTRFSSPYLVNKAYNRFRHDEILVYGQGETYQISGKAQEILTCLASEDQISTSEMLERLILSNYRETAMDYSM